MNLIKWNPLEQSLFDDEFSRFFRNWPMQSGDVIVPSMDVYMKQDDLVVEMPLPNVNPDKVEITINDQNVLTVKGRVEKKTEIDDKNYYRKEVKIGSFYRSVALPLPVQGDKASADYKDGILVISIPKVEEKKPTQIKINGANK
ncbi:MAG TPA: Hsp20/alpha crystallin family protein [bacterium]|nr:Hsp20/alpha crystallin family protein [bacterium]